MQEQARISSYQLFCIIVLFIFGSSALLQSLTIAGRDTWISAILGLGSGLLLVTVLTFLAKRFPDKTLVEYSQVLLGKIPGKVISFMYLWYFLHLASLVVRNYGDFMSTIVMPETPPWFFHITVALAAAFLVAQRVENIGRLGEIVLPLSISLSVLTSFLVMSSGHVDIRNLLPVTENGIGRVLLGALPPASFPYQEIVIFAMFFPYLNKVSRCTRVTAGAVVFSGLILITLLIQDIAIFGEYMATLTFPRFFAVRTISIGDFLQRIEALILAIWLMGGLVKIGICLYAFVLGLAQVLELKDYVPLVGPAALLMVVLTNILYQNIFEMLSFAVNIYPLYALPFQWGFPLLLLLAALVRKRPHS